VVTVWQALADLGKPFEADAAYKRELELAVMLAR
jgi:hypothetical protein